MAALLAAASGIGQDAPAVATGGNRVRVDVSVTQDHRPLTGLRAEDFVLLEEGNPREILAVSHDDLPLDIVVLSPERIPAFPIDIVELDYYIKRMQSTVANALLAMQPGDRVAFISHGMEPRILQSFTDDRNLMAVALSRLGPGSTEFLREWPGLQALAYEYAVRMLLDASGGDPTRRRLIIKLRGLPESINSGEYADGAIIRRLWRENIVLSAIVVVNERRHTPSPMLSPTREKPVDANFRLENPLHIAQATGGGVYFDLPGARQPGGLLADARWRYTLWFDPPGDLPSGAERRISIEQSEDARRRFPNAVVEARQGYVTH